MSLIVASDEHHVAAVRRIDRQELWRGNLARQELVPAVVHHWLERGYE